MRIDKENKQGQKLQKALQEGLLNESEKISKDRFNNVNNTQKKTLLKDMFEVVLRKVDANLNTNFRCFNVEHNDSNPSMRFNIGKAGYHCFGCMEDGYNFDVFDAIKEVYDYKSFKDCYNKAIELFVEKGQVFTKSRTKNLSFTKEMYRVMNYPFHNHISNDILGLEYLKNRGISEKTAKKHGLHTWEYQGWWFIVFINDNGSLVRRRFAKDERASMYADEPSKWWNQRGKSGFFNLRVTDKAELKDDIVFVTESAIDTLSVEEIGFYGVAINSAKHIRGFFEENNYPYLVALFDNDATGMISNTRFRGKGYYSTNYEDFHHLSKYKDINEALVADREATKEELEKLIKRAKEFYEI